MTSAAAASAGTRPRAWALALSLARRELRGGIAGFRVFLACLALGVAALAAIGSLRAAVEAGITGDARRLLGGDVSAHLAYRPASEAERGFLAASGTLSESARLRSMARSLDGARRSLIELQTVDAAYPLYGEVVLAPAQPLAAALRTPQGGFGAVADAAVATRLGLAVGDTFRIGDAVLRLTATIASLPDAAIGFLAFGPRVMISPEALTASGLIRPGALINYDYRVRFAAGSNAGGWIAGARAAFPQAGWQLRSSAEASPQLTRLIERIGFFLNLVGLSALLVGGIGVGNAVSLYIAGKTASIATLKCLGASSRLVFATYLLQILALAAVGIAAGLLLGALVPPLLAPAIGGLLPVRLRLGVYPVPLMIAALCGLCTTLVFALWPLAATLQVSAAALFRARIAPMRPPVAPAALLVSALAALALAAVVVLDAPDRRNALWYVGGVAAAFGLFRGVATLIAAAVRCLPSPRSPLLRLALANIYRPGAPTGRIVMSLGFGLGVVTAVALVEGNLVAEINGRLAERAPAYFFIDIQPDQLAEFTAIVAAAPATLSQVPMLRGRITRLNGTPVEDARIAAQAQWAVRSDRGLTYAALPPPGARIIDGEWWPAQYHGPPLVSFDADLAHGMGLAVGDTLSVDVLGREVTARIANLRQIDWTRLGINFAIVFAPGTLEAAPQTHLAAVYVAPPQEEELVRRITDRLPNVSAIPVREGLAAVERVIATVGAAIRLVALLTVAAGILVLAGAVAAGQRRRLYDAVVLKVLGATRGELALSFAIEHLVVGLLTALAAALIGTLAADAVVTWAMRLRFVWLPLPPLLIAALGVMTTLLFGLAGTWRALGARPAQYLREE